ncbi:hypothetical protein MRB53_016632 [Persea americana]|uniref:Uncharacterized protein n=1 Tax=Persea americana TaxID=3435 RepID=A0ACC2M2P7_PERAE|nr:hypothetical protein MRB53_016632 [Persea americana]
MQQGSLTIPVAIAVRSMEQQQHNAKEKREEEAARAVVSIAEGRRRAIGPVPGQCPVRVRSDPTQNETPLLDLRVANRSHDGTEWKGTKMGSSWSGQQEQRVGRDRFRNYPRYGGFWKREGAAKALVAEIEMK